MEEFEMTQTELILFLETLAENVEHTKENRGIKKGNPDT